MPILRAAIALSVAAALLSAAEPPAALPVRAVPKLLLGDAMSWSTAYSPRWRKGGRAGATDAGFYENAPLIPEAPAFRTWPQGQYGGDLGPTALADAEAAGIDALNICFFDGTSLDLLRHWAEVARTSGSRVRMHIFMDHMPREGADLFRRFWQDEALRTHPNILRVDGAPLVFCYHLKDNLAVVRQAVANAQAAGGRFFLIGDPGTSDIRITRRFPVEEAAPMLAGMQGVGYFGAFALAFRDDTDGILAGMMAFARRQSPPLATLATVRNGYIGMAKSAGAIIHAHGTDLFRRQWLEILREDPDIVSLATTNDYGEDSEQECSANNTFTFIDLNAYFSARWKTGAWPAAAAGQSFLSYRKAVAAGEPFTAELVLLRPELTGAEAAADLDRRFAPRVAIDLAGERIDLVRTATQPWPGHVAWRFASAAPLARDGFALPSVSLAATVIPAAPLPAAAVLRPGETVARKWLRVPLHRLRVGIEARIELASAADGAYPRTLRVTGLPWTAVAGGHLLLEGHPLSATIDPATLRDGVEEAAWDGPGWGPMRYADHQAKRRHVDQVDRYTAVVRLRDGGIAFPAPLALPPPREPGTDRPGLDPATVADYQVEPEGDALVDRGWLRRDLALPAVGTPERPAVLRDGGAGSWFLRFDGRRNGVIIPTPSTPPGPMTVELWLRPAALDRPQCLLGLGGSVLNLALSPRGSALQGGAIERYLGGWIDAPPAAIAAPGRVILTRMDERRRAVEVVSRMPLVAGRWAQVAAVFTGVRIELYVDGALAADPAPVTGQQMDEFRSYLGCWPWTTMGGFAGDLARLRVLQRAAGPEDVARWYGALRQTLP